MAKKNPAPLNPFEAIRNCLIRNMDMDPGVPYSVIMEETGIPTATLYRLLSHPDNEETMYEHGIYVVQESRPRLVRYNAEQQEKLRHAKQLAEQERLAAKTAAILEAKAFLVDNTITWWERQMIENLREVCEVIYGRDRGTVERNFKSAAEKGGLEVYGPMFEEYKDDPARLQMIFAMALVTPTNNLLRKEQE